MTDDAPPPIDPFEERRSYYAQRLAAAEERERDTRPRWLIFLSGWRLRATAVAGVVLALLVVIFVRRGLANGLAALAVAGGFFYLVGATFFLYLQGFGAGIENPNKADPVARRYRHQMRAVKISIPVAFASVVLIWTNLR